MPSRIRSSALPLRLGLTVFPGCLPAGLFAVADMIRACNLRAGSERVAVIWVGVDAKPVATWQGPELQPQVKLSTANCDVLLVPGMWLTSASDLESILQEHQHFISQLRALPKSIKLWSYCAGVAVLAAAGKLDGKNAAITWWLSDRVTERFSKTHWQRGENLIVDGLMVTASGANGYLPLMLDRLSGLYGEDVLRDVREVLMLPQPRARHDTFRAVDIMTLQNASLRKLLTFAHSTPARELDLYCAANHLNISIRTLCRQVQLATGMSAGDWLRRIKLRQASEALCGMNASIKQISDELGYSSEASLHRAFKKTTGLTLVAYRQQYGE
jgi:transcriptional regulator GlxA family with amidase domain